MSTTCLFSSTNHHIGYLTRVVRVSQIVHAVTLVIITYTDFTQLQHQVFIGKLPIFVNQNSSAFSKRKMMQERPIFEAQNYRRKSRNHSFQWIFRDFPRKPFSIVITVVMVNSDEKLLKPLLKNQPIQ